MKQAKVVARAPERVDRLHGRYRIVAGLWQGSFEARAYAGSKTVDSASEQTLEKAIETLETKLDERVNGFMEARQDAPAEAEYAEALYAIESKLSDMQRSLLRAHYARPGQSVSMAGLYGLTRYGSVDSVVAEYARVGRMIGAYLTFKPKDPEINRKILPLLVIATTDEPAAANQSWVLRPAFAAALAAHPKMIRFVSAAT